MRVVSRWTMALKLKLLGLWLCLGVGALAALQYHAYVHQQSLWTQQASARAALVEVHRLGQHLAAYQADYQTQVSSPTEASPALLAPAWQRLTHTLEHAAAQRAAGIPASVFGEANDALKTLHQLTLKSLQPPAEDTRLEWSLDKIQARLEVIEFIVVTRNKPAELNAWVELKRLQQEFTLALAPEALNRLANFTDDLISSFKLVVRPDATQGQLVAHLEAYRALLKPQSIAQKRPLTPVPAANFNTAAQKISQLQQAVQAKVQAVMDSAQQLHQRGLWCVAGGLTALLLVGLWGLYAVGSGFSTALALCGASVRNWQQGQEGVHITSAPTAEWIPFCETLNDWLSAHWRPLQQKVDSLLFIQTSVDSLVEQLQPLVSKNLTQKLPVDNTATGAISDILNRLIETTAKTLWEVQQTLQQLGTTLASMQDTAQQVLQVADEERKQVIATGRALEISAKALHEVAREAQSVEHALQTGWPNASAVPPFIDAASLASLWPASDHLLAGLNAVAERAHILELNTRLQSLQNAAHEAPVAQFVQHIQPLAASAKQAVADLTEWLHQAQGFTQNTSVLSLNALPEASAGQSLTPINCREPLQRVAQGAVQQAELAGRLRDRAAIIRTYIEKTALQLNQQKRQMETLNGQIATLAAELDTFVLPGFYNGVRVTHL